MNLSESEIFLISNLRRISEGLTSQSELEKAIRLIAREACPTGRTARIYLFKLLSQSKVHLMASSNGDFSEAEAICYATQFLPLILSGGIYSKAMTEHVHDLKFLRKFEKVMGHVESDLWNSTLLIPLEPNFLMSLSLYSRADGSNERSDYFHALRAIMQLSLGNLIDSNRDADTIMQQRRPRNIEGKLTERQELILELIQTGKTNPVIARLLGYSESLIRQESISIYRKLGIKGRKDLEIIAQPPK